MKQKRIMKMTAILVAFAMMIGQLFTTNLFSMQVTAASRNVLWSGNASVSGEWSTWSSATSYNVTDSSIFSSPFELQVTYKSTAAPILVFQSWSGGEPWVQLNAFYAANGVAYYPYDSIKNALGYDSSLINCIAIYPNGADLTATELALCPASATEDVSIHYNGLAGTLVDEMGAGWNLGNTLDSCGDWITQYGDGSTESFETAWGNPVTSKAIIDSVKAAGFNAIRIPVTWSQHIDDANDYKIDEAWMNRVQEVVDYAMDDDLIVILNVHHDTGTDGWLRATQSSYNNYWMKFQRVWEQIASRFQNYSNKLLFEGFNEILNDENNWGYPGTEATSIVNDWNQLFVDTVRSTGGANSDRCLIVNTYCANSDSAVLDDFVLPQDSAQDSLIVEVHYYNPYFYCATISDSTTQDDWTINGGETVVAGAMYSLYKHFTSKGIPVIIGEVAAANKNNTANRVDYTSFLVNNASKYGIKCFWWDEGNKHEVDSTYGYFTGMSLFNRYTLTWDFPEVRDAFVNSVYDNITIDNPIAPTHDPSETPVTTLLPTTETPASSAAPVTTTPEETPVVSQPAVTVTPSESTTPETPATTEVPVSPSASADPELTNIPSVAISSTIGSNVSMNYTITSKSGTIDLSKVKLCFSYSKAGNEAENFWCDNAGISYHTAPYYTNYTSNVAGTFTEDGLTIQLTGSSTIDQGDSITIQTRMNQANWTSYQDFTPESVTVYYDNVLCQTITF